ncbi:MAG TPA: hypothetical protein VNJ07_04870 [Chitinophagales bacterium]|nr:hypothetical protein [Chitinophagales bacterium]
MKKYFLSGLMGFGISAGCLLPPVLHFVTGPLGPFIGGFAGGMKARAKIQGAVVIGLTMGICLSLFLLLLALVIASFQISLPALRNGIFGNDSLTFLSLLKIVLIPFSIATVLGTAGAYLGGRVVSKKAAESK